MKNIELKNKVLFQCYLDPDVKSQALKIAEEKGQPLAFIIRKLIDKWLAEAKTDA